MSIDKYFNKVDDDQHQKKTLDQVIETEVKANMDHVITNNFFRLMRIVYREKYYTTFQLKTDGEVICVRCSSIYKYPNGERKEEPKDFITYKFVSKIALAQFIWTHGLKFRAMDCIAPICYMNGMDPVVKHIIYKFYIKYAMKMAGLIFDHYKVRPGLKRFIIGHGFEYDHKSIKSIVYERGMKEYNIINKILANEKMLHLYGLAKLQDILVLRKAFCSSVSMGKIKIDSKDVRKALSIWPKYRDLSSQAIPIQPDANLRETRELNLRRLQLDRDIFILLSFNRGEEMIKNLAKHNNPSTWESRISVIKDIVSTKPMWTKGMFSSITRSEDTNIINQAYTFIHNMTKDRIQAICTKMELVYLYPDVLFENKSRMKILNRIKSYLKVPMDNDVAIFGIANFKWIKTLKEFAKVEDSVKWVSNLKLDTPYFDFDKLEDVEDERFVLKLIKTKDLAERVAREHQHCLYISYWDGRGYGYQLFCVMDKRDNLIGSAEVKMGILDGRLTHTVAQYRGNHNAELDTHNLEILLDKYFARPEVNISLVHNYCQDKGATNHPNLFNPLLGQ